jgi:hypothetical protein
VESFYVVRLKLNGFINSALQKFFLIFGHRMRSISTIDDRHDFVSAYYKKLTDENPSVRLAAAKVWSKWEAATSRLFIDAHSVDEFEDPTYALTIRTYRVSLLYE